MNEGHGAGVVNGRRRVGHTDNGGESTACCGGGAGGDVFLGGLAGFAEVNVQVNQAGAHDESFGVECFDVARGLFGGVWTDGGYLAVENQEVGDGIKTIGGINHTTAGEEKRIHRGTRLATVN